MEKLLSHSDIIQPSPLNPYLRELGVITVARLRGKVQRIEWAPRTAVDFQHITLNFGDNLIAHSARTRPIRYTPSASAAAGALVQQGLSATNDCARFKHRRAADKRYLLGPAGRLEE